MEKCINCGKPAIIKTMLGKEVLCKKCDLLIGASFWNKREFSSMEDLQEKKNKALSSAKTNNFSEKVIESIEKYFDEYIKEGFITSINGRAGQTIKVFDNYCIINTKSENAKSDLVHLFYQFEDDYDDEEDDEVLSADDKLNLAKGVLRGGLIKTGLGVAKSAGLKQSAKEQLEEKRDKLRKKNLEKMIKVGDKKLFFKDYYAIETLSKSNKSNGYLKLVPKGEKADNLYECEYFFFNNSIPFESKKIKQKVEDIKDIIEEKLSPEDVEKPKEESSNNQTKSDTDKFEEIRKYKQLLDENIISEEEFEAKKKELLKL